MRRKLLFICCLLCTLKGWGMGQTFQYGYVWYEIISEANASCRVIKNQEYPYLYGKYDEIANSVRYNGKRYTVIEIGDCAFQSSEVESVTIPNSVTTIGENAFASCIYLTSIKMSDSVTTINAGAFAKCPHLSSIRLPPGITRIASNTFYQTDITFCDIPEGVTEIGESAFKNTPITSIQIPKSVTSIYGSAFENCYKLTSISIPNTVTHIGNNAFNNCTSVKKLIYEEGCKTAFRTYLTSIESVVIPNSITRIDDDAFRSCTHLLNSINIPQSVTEIGQRAFYGCTGLTTVTIPKSVMKVGEGAFYGCSSVKKLIYEDGCKTAFRTYLTSIEGVEIPNSITSIDNSAFINCNKLTSVSIPNSVESVGDYAFEGCTSLPLNGSYRCADTYLVKCMVSGAGQSLSIPEGIRFIGTSAFKNNTMKQISIPEGVISIGQYAFEDCSALTSCSLPNSMKSIGQYAFSGCSSMVNLHIYGNIQNIGSKAFAKTKIYRLFLNFKNNQDFANYITRTDIEKVFYPYEIQSVNRQINIGQSLQSKINIPKGVTNIGKFAFLNFTEITSVTIPNSVTHINKYAFEGCNKLTTVTIGKSVTNISKNAFPPSATSITCYAVEPPQIDKESFATYGTLHVLAGCKNTYQEREFWNRFTIVEDAKNPDILVSKISITPNSAELTIGETIQLKATVTPNDADNSSVSWTSSNQNVATISATGLVTAHSDGETIITCKANDASGITASCKISVKKNIVSKISITPNSAELTIGETIQLKATVTPNDADNSSVSWTSSNQNVATISATGLVTAHSDGETIITCKANDASGITASCKISVKKNIKSFIVYTTEIGYATFYSSESAYKLPANVKAQVVSGYNNSKLTYSTIAEGNSSGIIPQGTAVMLVTNSGKWEALELTPVESSEKYDGVNYLHGCDETSTTSTNGTNWYYKLTCDWINEYCYMCAWFWGANSGEAFTIEGHKAWLALPKHTNEQRAFAAGDGIGIDPVVSNEPNVYFDLQGHQMGTKPNTPGIYIVNGKKVIINK